MCAAYVAGGPASARTDPTSKPAGHLKGSRITIDKLLLDPPAYLETAKVFDMLLAVPKYGRVKANKVLQQCRISPSKTIGGLSQRQRTELVSMLRR